MKKTGNKIFKVIVFINTLYIALLLTFNSKFLVLKYYIFGIQNINSNLFSIFKKFTVFFYPWFIWVIFKFNCNCKRYIAIEFSLDVVILWIAVKPISTEPSINHTPE